jgi:hypothetical protein
LRPEASIFQLLRGNKSETVDGSKLQMQDCGTT